MINVEPRCRIIVDNDWAGDPDGLVGLAHHALSPASRIAAVTSSLTNLMFGRPEGMARGGADLAEDLLRVLKLPKLATVHAGSDIPFTGQSRNTAAGQAIIDAVKAGSVANEDEYNYYTDPAAARFVLENQQLVVWQFPLKRTAKLSFPLPNSTTRSRRRERAVPGCGNGSTA
jgi:inosine-uridine nucleoside N-ribohydrolase